MNKQLTLDIINTQQGVVLAQLSTDGFYYYTYTYDGIEFTGKIAPSTPFTGNIKGRHNKALDNW